jgi:hypothetical protein
MTKHYIKMAYPKTQMAEYHCDDGLVAAARRIGGGVGQRGVSAISQRGMKAGHARSDMRRVGWLI